MSASQGNGLNWGIVLAGGAGTRLSSLTTNANGVSIPKQYCALDGRRALITSTLERALRILPRERILVVVAEEHAAYWRPLLSDWPGRNVIVQPRNRGTAPGILLPLLEVLDRDEHARIALFPSDHFIDREDVIEACLKASLSTVESRTVSVVLMGITPDRAEPDYGWILPGAGCGSDRQVEAFVEKPGQQQAIELERRGAVWNSFLMVASGSSLVQLYRHCLPDLLDAFRSCRAHVRTESSIALYDRLETTDFSRDVLQRSEQFLQVKVVPRCGWTDLGTPERVRRCFPVGERVGSKPAHMPLEMETRHSEPAVLDGLLARRRRVAKCIPRATWLGRSHPPLQQNEGA